MQSHTCENKGAVDSVAQTQSAVSLPVDKLCHLLPFQLLGDAQRTAWVCRLCIQAGSAETEPLARSGGIQHLVSSHSATVMGD